MPAQPGVLQFLGVLDETPTWPQITGDLLVVIVRIVVVEVGIEEGVEDASGVVIFNSRARSVPDVSTENAKDGLPRSVLDGLGKLSGTTLKLITNVARVSNGQHGHVQGGNP